MRPGALRQPQLSARDRDLADPGRYGMAPSPTWQPLPEPVPDHLCQLCEQDLDGRVTDDGLCGACRLLLEQDDHQAWVDAGGRSCRRCHRDVPAAGAIDGLCPCGGTLV